MKEGDDRATARILVVDDDQRILRLFGKLLAEGGHSAVLLQESHKVIQTLKSERFDLLVLDLDMPKPDGFELLKRLRREMPGLRILVVSGYLHGALLHASELLGARASLNKADVPGRFLETVDLLLGTFPAQDSTA